MAFTDLCILQFFVFGSNCYVTPNWHRSSSLQGLHPLTLQENFVIAQEQFWCCFIVVYVIGACIIIAVASIAGAP